MIGYGYTGYYVWVWRHLIGYSYTGSYVWVWLVWRQMIGNGYAANPNRKPDTFCPNPRQILCSKHPKSFVQEYTPPGGKGGNFLYLRLFCRIEVRVRVTVRSGQG